jgi:hypothetical protein
VKSDILTDSYCERCGSCVPSDGSRTGRGRSAAHRARYLVRGLRGGESGDDLVAAAVDGFTFCIECRQYVCPRCWNDGAGRCRTCSPLADQPDPLDEVTSADTAVTGPPEQPIPAEAWPSVDLLPSLPDAPAGGFAHGPTEVPADRVDDSAVDSRGLYDVVRSTREIRPSASSSVSGGDAESMPVVVAAGGAEQPPAPDLVVADVAATDAAELDAAKSDAVVAAHVVDSDAVVADAAELDAAVAAEPEAAEPEAAVADTLVVDAAEPDAVVAGAAEPRVAEPDAIMVALVGVDETEPRDAANEPSGLDSVTAPAATPDGVRVDATPAPADAHDADDEARPAGQRPRKRGRSARRRSSLAARVHTDPPASAVPETLEPVSSAPQFDSVDRPIDRAVADAGSPTHAHLVDPDDPASSVDVAIQPRTAPGGTRAPVHVPVTMPSVRKDGYEPRTHTVPEFRIAEPGAAPVAVPRIDVSPPPALPVTLASPPRPAPAAGGPWRLVAADQAPVAADVRRGGPSRWAMLGNVAAGDPRYREPVAVPAPTPVAAARSAPVRAGIRGCSQCALPLSANARFCRRCGASQL